MVLMAREGYGISLTSKNDRYNGDWGDERFCRDVTADYLRNTKIKTESPEHSEFVQRLVFGAGGEWFGGSKRVDLMGFKYLFVDADLNIERSKSSYIFERSDNKEILLPLPPKACDQARYDNITKSINIAKAIDEVLSEVLNAHSNVDRGLIENKKMKERPAYTKQMHERGELPPVGSEVIVGSDSKPSIVVANKPDDNGMIVTKFDGEYLITCIDVVKPIPSPVDELAEILADEVGEWTSKIIGEGAKEVGAGLAKAIINGEIKGLSYKPE